MESHEVLKKAVTEIGTKAIASDMSLSASLIYKWCEPKDSPDAGGADNPLDRLARVYELTGDTGPVEWLCQKAGGFYVPNQSEKSKEETLTILPVTQKILKEFSEMLSAVSKSLEDDGQIDEEEAGRIRKEWEELKSIAESFVVACEKGEY